MIIICEIDNFRRMDLTLQNFWIPHSIRKLIGET